MKLLEIERKKLNHSISQGLNSQACMECSRRVDAILEQLIEIH